MNPLVTIIITCYNSEKYIHQNVMSVLQQTYGQLEVIVVNDGSTDQSRTILEAFNDPRLRIIHQENHGCNHARNQGFKLSQGDYLMFLDSDDLLHPSKIEEQVRIVEKQTTDVLISGAWLSFETSVEETTFSQNPLFRNFNDPIEYILTAWKTNSMIQPGVWLISRKLMEHAGLWNEELRSDDDGDFIIRLLCKASCVLYSEKSILYYRAKHAGSQSAQSSAKHMNSRYKAAVLQTQFLLQHENSTRTRKVVADRWMFRAYELMLYSVPLGRKARSNSIRFGHSTVILPETKIVRILKNIIGLTYARRIQGLSYQIKKTWRK